MSLDRFKQICITTMLYHNVEELNKPIILQYDPRSYSKSLKEFIKDLNTRIEKENIQEFQIAFRYIENNVVSTLSKFMDQFYLDFMNNFFPEFKLELIPQDIKRLDGYLAIKKSNSEYLMDKLR